jgi:hypothetical protein
MTPRIHDDPTGGFVLWCQTQTLTADSMHVISVILGSINPMKISFDDSLWISAEVDGEVLEPRRELAAVPYAFNALQINGTHSSTTPQPNRLLPLDSSARVPEL